jgi:hypothetical protein
MFLCHFVLTSKDWYSSSTRGSSIWLHYYLSKPARVTIGWSIEGSCTPREAYLETKLNEAASVGTLLYYMDQLDYLIWHYLQNSMILYTNAKKSVESNQTYHVFWSCKSTRVYLFQSIFYSPESPSPNFCLRVTYLLTYHTSKTRPKSSSPTNNNSSE